MSVHWLVQNGSDVPPGVDWLAPGEQEALAALRFPKRRADWRLGRWTAKRAVCALLGLDEPGGWPEVEVRNDPLGAPFVRHRGQAAPCRLSISHRADAALCSVAPLGHELGCDLEWIEPRSAAFVEDYLVESERAVLEAAPAAERELLGNLFWSAKESASKALGLGLRLDARELRVALDEPLEESWRGFSVSFRGQVLHGWWRRCGRYLLTVVDRWQGGPPIALAHGARGTLLRTSVERAVREAGRREGR